MISQLLAQPNVEFTEVLQVLSIGITEYSKKKGSPYQVVLLADSTAQQVKAKIYQGNGVPMPPQLVNTQQTFQLKSSVFKGNTYVQGFWQNPQQQPANQPPQQQGRSLPVSTGQQTTEIGDMTKIRSMAYSYVKDIAIAELQAKARINIRPVSLIPDAIEITAFIATGIQPNQTVDEPEQREPGADEEPPPSDF